MPACGCGALTGNGAAENAARGEEKEQAERRTSSKDTRNRVARGVCGRQAAGMPGHLGAVTPAGPGDDPGDTRGLIKVFS